MPHSDKSQISQQEHELNTALKANGLAQTEANRKILSKDLADYKNQPNYNQNDPKNRENIYNDVIKKNISKYEKA